MEYLQRTTTLQVTHNPHSILCRVGGTRLKKGDYFIRAKALAQEVLYGPGGGGYEYTPPPGLYGLCVILWAKGSTPNSTKELLLHKVPPILLNKPLSTILLRVGCTHSVWRFAQVYDIVNDSVYQVYSKFRIRNSEFRIRNSELWIVTEMKKWAIWAIVVLGFYLDMWNADMKLEKQGLWYLTLFSCAIKVFAV